MGITISVKTGLDAQSSSVTASGSVQHIITDAERGTFGVNDGDLKNAVGKYFGQAPDDAFLRSDTPWGDLYRTYGWPQVQTVLVVQSATITGITSVPSVVAQNILRNSPRRSMRRRRRRSAIPLRARGPRQIQFRCRKNSPTRSRFWEPEGRGKPRSPIPTPGEKARQNPNK